MKGIGAKRELLLAGGLLITAALAVLSGCGGSPEGDGGSSDSAVERSASVMPSYNTSCPERGGSRTLKGSVFNAVPGVLNLRIFVPQGSYDCSDWSGASTPGMAFDGLEVSPGYPESYKLELDYPWMGVPGGPWTIETRFPIFGGSRELRASTRLTTLDKNTISNEPTDRSKLRKTGWVTKTDRGDLPIWSFPFADASMISDSSPEAVSNGCEQEDGRIFGFGVYEGKLSVIFCSRP